MIWVWQRGNGCYWCASDGCRLGFGSPIWGSAFGLAFWTRSWGSQGGNGGKGCVSRVVGGPDGEKKKRFPSESTVRQTETWLFV